MLAVITFVLGFSVGFTAANAIGAAPIDEGDDYTPVRKAKVMSRNGEEAEL